eukprot:14052.XXX_898774_900314_1 [CDS] Oithona nana genome sequencing.
MEMGNGLAQRISANAYIECSAKENRGLRHIVEEAVWILNSAVISAATELNAIDEASNGGTSMNNAARKWSLSSSYPSKASPKHKSRKTSESISRGNRKLSTTSTGSTASYTSPRPNICVQDPFSTSLPSSIVASAVKSSHRKQSYGAAVRKIWQNVSTTKPA